MHTMFILETPVINENILLACQSSTDAFPSLKNERFKSALSKMKRRRKPSNSPANDDRVVLFMHHGYYIELSKRHH
jgi:hypothetical protein